MNSLLELIPLRILGDSKALGSRANHQHKFQVLLPTRSAAATPSSSCGGVSTSSSDLEELRAVQAPSSLSDAFLGGATSLASALHGQLRPNGPGIVEEHSKLLNILTSLPYVALGWGIVRQCESTEAKAYGYSVMGVGAGAMVFHLTDGRSGPERIWARRLDYWTIAAATAAMMRAVFPQAQGRARTAAVAAIPFQPFSVSAGNIAAMEVEYFKRARAPGADAKLRRAHALHAGAVGIGTTCFFLEDLMPHVPGLHSAWHCLSAVALATTGDLLKDVEKSRGIGGGAAADLKPIPVTAAA